MGASFSFQDRQGLQRKANLSENRAGRRNHGKSLAVRSARVRQKRFGQAEAGLRRTSKTLDDKRVVEYPWFVSRSERLAYRAKSCLFSEQASTDPRLQSTVATHKAPSVKTFGALLFLPAFGRESLENKKGSQPVKDSGQATPEAPLSAELICAQFTTLLLNCHLTVPFLSKRT